MFKVMGNRVWFGLVLLCLSGDLFGQPKKLKQPQEPGKMLVSGEYEFIAKDEFGTLGLSGAMMRAEGARKAQDKALSPQMQKSYDSLLTPFEKSKGLGTANYFECVAWYKQLAATFPAYCSLQSIGLGDVGKDIYVLKLNGPAMDRMDRFGNGDVGLEAGPKVQATPLVKVLINNNIHPGEPEGTDACMILLRDMLFFGQYWQQVLPYLQLHVICQYNVDGTLTRSGTSRANQNGPVEYGFRGNAQNLDLNRDFIKLDSRNAKSLVALMAMEQYDLFIDNHTSNGADYQYVLTYFHTRPEKLQPGLTDVLLPFEKSLKERLQSNQWPTAPYVETIKTVPDSGLFAFWEGGRYATGFAALHHTLGYTVETHMLKPFSQRMLGTLAFMEQFLIAATAPSLRNEFSTVRRKNVDFAPKPIGKWMPIQFQLDQTKFTEIDFLGFESGYRPSEISGADRLVYDRTKPWSKKVKYYDQYRCTDSSLVPTAYIVPFAYGDVIQKLKLNKVVCKPIPFDTVTMLRVSYITEFKTVNHPYEKHYMHHGVKTRDTVLAVQLRAGDVVVPITSVNAKFVVSVLEPRCADSYFAWNAFDGVLMQKEGYSDYVFEDLAADWLKDHPEKRAEFLRKKANDSEFAKDTWGQLNWVYKQSAHYEKTHNLYPVYRLD